MVSPGEPIGAGKDDVELYVRTYSTMLRSSGEVRLRAFEAAHVRVRSSLHSGAGAEWPDAGAFIYAIQRLPDEVAHVEKVVLGQEGERFRALLGDEVTHWQRLEAPARRRQWRWDGSRVMTVHVASPSDLDDVLPCLVAYQIEWNKLHALLRALARERLLAVPQPAADEIEQLGARLGFLPDDWLRLQAIWGGEFWTRLRQIAVGPKDMTVRLLGGHDIGYTRLVRRWWAPIDATMAQRELAGRPLYFISSNMHGVVNLLSGYARRRDKMLWRFLEEESAQPGAEELAELQEMRGRANAENVLYYAARLWHRHHPQAQAKQERRVEEEERGIVQGDAAAGFGVGAQLIELARLRPADFDPRLAELAHVATGSDAVILNVDYPLGLASYHILREVAAEALSLRGAYAIGKAAT